VTSVFAKPEYLEAAYPYRFSLSLHGVTAIAGGTPSDPKIAEGWLRTKLAGKDDLIREAVAEVMVERGVTADEAARVVDASRHLIGFKRDETHGLFIDGRTLKACVKESANIARAVGKLPDRWGLTRKGIDGFVAEHCFITEDRLYLGVTEASGIEQRFVHNKRFGSSILYQEYVEDWKLDATVISDHAFTDREWAMLWLTAQENGLGASRSQGFGRFQVSRWDAITSKPKRHRNA
jgi:hypothetical protein